jgi:ribosomal protein S18 acetylase RimI-like enzyme
MTGALKSRVATIADSYALLRMMAEFNDGEGIKFADVEFAPRLEKLLRSPELGAALVFEMGAVIGYAIVTWGFDLEYGGRDSYLTELWIDPAHRGKGHGKAALSLVEDFARQHGAGALHLAVRADNLAATRLYERNGYTDWPRRVMSKLL